MGIPLLCNYLIDTQREAAVNHHAREAHTPKWRLCRVPCHSGEISQYQGSMLDAYLGRCLLCVRSPPLLDLAPRTIDGLVTSSEYSANLGVGVTLNCG